MFAFLDRIDKNQFYVFGSNDYIDNPCFRPLSCPLSWLPEHHFCLSRAQEAFCRHYRMEGAATVPLPAGHYPPYRYRVFAT